MNHVLDAAFSLLTAVTSIPSSTWVGFLSLLGGGLSVSIVTELYKRHRLNKREVQLAKSFIGLVITALSGVLTLAQSVVMYGAVNPHFLGVHTAQVMGAVSAVYLFGGSAAYKKVADFLSRLKAAFDAVSADSSNSATTTTEPAPDASTLAVSASSDLLQ